jgi:AcrR family transcriptional regulator
VPVTLGNPSKGTGEYQWGYRERVPVQSVTVLSDSPDTLPHAATPSRDRLLRALAASIKKRGYRDTKVGDIVAHARTSRRTFYEVFDTKEDCFLALLEEMNQQVQAVITAAMDPRDPWDEQVRAGVTAWVEMVAAEPEIGVAWIRELPTLGERAQRAQRAALRSFTQMLTDLTDTPEMRRAGVPAVTKGTATVLLGGLRELAVSAYDEGVDVRTITEPAIEAAQALLGPRPAVVLSRTRRQR